jgi:hypothetical protein
MEKPRENPSASAEPERINIVLKVLLFTMVAIPTVACWVFFFGKFYGSIAITACFLLAVFMRSLRKRRKVTEAEMIRRIDKAMGKPSDDPRQMARFMR